MEVCLVCCVLCSVSLHRRADQHQTKAPKNHSENSIEEAKEEEKKLTKLLLHSNQ